MFRNKNGISFGIVHWIIEMILHSTSVIIKNIQFNGVMIIDTSKLESSCFNGNYKDFVELIGHDNTIILHENFAGQYVTFPKKLLADAYIHELILREYDGKNAKALAKKYNYTYSWIMKLLKKLNK